MGAQQSKKTESGTLPFLVDGLHGNGEFFFELVVHLLDLFHFELTGFAGAKVEGGGARFVDFHHEFEGIVAGFVKHVHQDHDHVIHGSDVVIVADDSPSRTKRARGLNFGF